jgi:hypothetical protein
MTIVSLVRWVVLVSAMGTAGCFVSSPDSGPMPFNAPGMALDVAPRTIAHSGADTIDGGVTVVKVVGGGGGGSGGSGSSGSPGNPSGGGGSTSDTQPIKCSTADLGGIGIPDGTQATASASYQQGSAISAIDGNLDTAWSSGSYSGWLRLDFPDPVAMIGVHLAVNAAPAASEKYVFTGSGSSTPIGSATRSVKTGVTVILDPIFVTSASYSSLTITVDGGQSWVSIAEVALLTSACPR